MAKNFLIIALIILVIVIIYQVFFNHPPLNTAPVNIKGQEFNLEIAKTMPQQSLGLGKRDQLCTKCGMIFVWDIEMSRSFWMKDTLIPLDIIFLDKNGQVINFFTAYPEPGVSDLKLKIYRSLSPAKYVVELNAGTAQKLDLHPGDVIKL